MRKSLSRSAALILLSAAVFQNCGQDHQTDRTSTIQFVHGYTVLHLPEEISGKADTSRLTVLRAEGRFGSYTPAGTVNGSSFTDKDSKGRPYTYYYRIVDESGNVLLETSPDKELFGDNVYIYSPADDMDSVGTQVNGIHDMMFRQQFSPERYAVLFKPGDYREAGLLNVPYYMQIAGLGSTPYEVRLSNIHTPAPLRDDNGTCTFWRSAENLSVMGEETYEEEETFKWAVSQAAPLRRIHSTRVMRSQWGNGWVSGGFAADCHFEAAAGSDHQQQWYYRNSILAKGRGEFLEEKYNYCFQGVVIGPDADVSTYRDNWSSGGNVTFIDTTPVIREKPFLFIGDDGRYKVFRPALKRDSRGLSYTESYIGDGETLDVVNDFLVVKPGMSAAEMNRALAKGRHLLITPGMYLLEEPLHVSRKGTIILGLGFATLTPGESNNDTAIAIDDVDGVTIASLMFDAHYSSSSLIRAGDGRTEKRHQEDPTLLADLFFRIGGFRPAAVHVDRTVEINSNDVIGDHFWIWRADHGVRGSVGWDINTAPNGLVVNGDHVTVYGLFNEHFQEYQTLWNGEYGETYFFQCETPYDAPDQGSYMSENGTRDGYAAYKVADSVDHHYATAFGIYDVLVREIRIENSVEVPQKPDVRLHNICNNSLSSPPDRGFGFIVNGQFPSTYNTWRDNRTYIVDFPER